MSQTSQHRTVQFFERDQSKQALFDWITECNLPVFGALLFHTNASADKVQRGRMLRLYWNTLDRCYFGNQVARKGLRINRHVVLHVGANGDNLHAHFLSETIGDSDEFCRHARLVWANLSDDTMSYDCTRIEPVNEIRHATAYLLHENNGAENYCPILSALRSDSNIVSTKLSHEQKLRSRRAAFRKI